ncbi:hypothetical protein [Streptomyces sp. NPDC056480]|uniref:hypothetical protein n=1 Tax=Streptomyces sp. NPDC056480 TaxID=3345833 RepID=UPI003676DB2F
MVTDAEVTAAAGLGTDHLHTAGSGGSERTAPALEAAVAAIASLLQAHPAPLEAQARLRRRTVARLAALLGLDHGADEPGEVRRISVPSHRLEIAVVATLHDDLAALVERARAELATVPPGVGRLVVYTAGPRFLGPEKIADTLYVHIDELTEILSAVGGDLTSRRPG